MGPHRGLRNLRIEIQVGTMVGDVNLNFQSRDRTLAQLQLWQLHNRVELRIVHGPLAIDGCSYRSGKRQVLSLHRPQFLQLHGRHINPNLVCLSFRSVRKISVQGASGNCHIHRRNDRTILCLEFHCQILDGLIVSSRIHHFYGARTHRIEL